MIKLLLNPLIYALRMQHIRNSVLYFLLSFSRLWPCSNRRDSTIPNRRASIFHRQSASKDSYTICNGMNNNESTHLNHSTSKDLI